MENVFTPMEYIGKVNLKFKIGNKVVDFTKNNKGLPALFRIISKALAGFNTMMDKPSYIDLRYIEFEGSTEWESCLSKNQSITQLSYTVENGSWVTKAMATIPYSAISVPSIESLDAYAFRVYLLSESEELAYIDINKESIMEITPGTQALVEWVLRVSNYS